MRRAGLPIVSLDVGEVPIDSGPDDAPFLRPKQRMSPRRARRSALAKAILALRLLALVVVIVAGVWTLYAKTMASERLKVGRLEVRGMQFLSEGEVKELLGPALGENILTLDIDALKARLRSSPWVADATVGRTLPNTLKVEIEERVPLALAEVERLYLMDKDGGLIDLYGPRTASFDLPIVRGLAGVDEEARRHRAERAGALIDDLGDLAGEVSEVFVLSSGDLRVVLRGAGEVLLLGEPPYHARVLTFLSLRKELLERCPNAEHFDLRFQGRIYAKLPPSPPPAAASVPPARPAAAPAGVAPTATTTTTMAAPPIPVAAPFESSSTTKSTPAPAPPAGAAPASAPETTTTSAAATPPPGDQGR